MPVLELRDVNVAFSTGRGRRHTSVLAMNDVSLSIDEGETVGLVGESGSGKSTTGLVALGMIRPTAGSVEFGGEPFPRRRRALEGQIQAVLQNPQASLDPRLRIGAAVAEPLDILGRRGDRDNEVAQGLEDVGLAADFADRYPHELSGGQLQRVAIARALITRPKFVVFDESVSALDVSVQAQILNLIRRLQVERGFAALFITHDLEVVGYLSHRLCVMKDGVVVEQGQTDDVLDHPDHPYTRALLGTDTMHGDKEKTR